LVRFTVSTWTNDIKAEASGAANYWTVITEINLTQQHPINSSQDKELSRLILIFNDPTRTLNAVQ